MKLSSLDIPLVTRHSSLVTAALAAIAASATEPIKWTGGDWDDAGAPKGALLSDNPGWWGRSVFTGVTYAYAEGHEPTAPRDIRKDGGEESFGRRLLDGKKHGDWNTTVGKGGKTPLIAIFDFKRPCAFSEVDLFISRNLAVHGVVETSDDGTNWTVACSFTLSSPMARISLEKAKARFLRLSIQAEQGIVYLDEVLVWGEGEVSERYPEAIADIPAGDALHFVKPHDGGGIEIRPIAKPTLDECKVESGKWKVDAAASGGPGAVPAAADTEVGPPREILLARNETEVRYFAIANASAHATTVSLAPPDFGDPTISAELLIGGVVRMVRPAPKEKLTQKQIIDLLITDESKLYEEKPQRLDVLPFFRGHALPAPNFARRYLANPAQVTGFPAAVPLAPGEGCVVMLRVTTAGAKPGRREGAFVATVAPSASSPLREGGGGEAAGGSTPCRSEQTRSTPPAAVGGSPLSEGADMSSVVAESNRQTVKPSNCQTGVADATPLASLPVSIDVRDATLPNLPLWIHAYSPFTSQFPFESESRMKTDAARLAALGVGSCYGLPHPRTKSAFLKALAPHTICAQTGWVSSRVFGGAYGGKWEHFDSTNRAEIAKGAHAVVREAQALGLKPEEYCIFMPDEPGRKNAALVGEMARICKEAEPTLQIYENPCFWERGFPPHEAILDCLKPYYNELIDISCPIRNLVQETNLLTKTLWTAPRRVNAQYLHPAVRAGRSIAWSSFRNGLNGFAYYCYYSPRGNPWDIRTWTSLDYRYQMVFPLENDVAVTPIYETMRKAWEDYRMLEALRRAGKTDLLTKLLDAYEGATDYADWENVPNRSDFQSLHDKALGAF